MRGPGDPAEVSESLSGELADTPESSADIKVIEVNDQDGDVVGLFVKWDSAEWFWADIGSYDDLSNLE